MKPITSFPEGSLSKVVPPMSEYLPAPDFIIRDSLSIENMLNEVQHLLNCL